MKIRLETRDGRFVGEKGILPFQILPEIVLWGERYFTHSHQTGDAMPVYREAFCFPILEIQRGTDGT